MKTFNKLYKLWLILFITATMLSCQDIVTYNDGYDDGLTSYGPPQINKISTAANIDNSIDAAAMTSMIVLHGDNLTGVTSIRFNDVEVDLESIYAVRSRITLPVPRVVPADVTNTVTVTTDKGTASFPFKVNIPDLVVEGFYNEFVAAGDTTIVIGKYLDLYLLDTLNGVFTLNGATIKPIRSVEDSIYFVIPVGTADGTQLTMSSPLLEESLHLSFREHGHSILDLSSVGNVTDGSANGDPNPLPGFDKFMRIHQSFGAWSWNGFFWSGFNLPDPDILDYPNNYYVKFEINTKSSNPISNVYWILGGDRQELRWDPGYPVNLNTLGKWKTVRLELTELYKDASQPNGTYLNAGWNAFVFSYQPQVDVNDDFSVCNFRIVKK